MSLDKLFVSKREFLAISAIFVEACARRPGRVIRPEYTAQDFFESFPEGLSSGIIRKYPVDNPAQCLVHIKMIHGGRFIPEDKKQMVDQVQHDIYQIVKSLIRRYGIRDIRHEGFYEEGNLTRQAVKHYKEMTRIAGNHYQYYAGAIPKLAYEGEVSVKKGDDKIIMDGIIERRNHDPYSKYDGRENALLDVIAKEGDTVNILIYGGWHAFAGTSRLTEDITGVISTQNNIATFNSMFPDKKIAFIEVVPSAYLQYIGFFNNPDISR
ncbi:MAG: hypothetical protein ABIJ08_03325 [Nanoarchaeota archaeon]